MTTLHDNCVHEENSQQTDAQPSLINETVQINDLFGFTPFGLYCLHPDCKNRPQIKATERAIQRHLHKHSVPNRKNATTKEILSSFSEETERAKLSKDITQYREDNVTYTCFICVCSETFPNRKDNAQRHCRKTGCDISKLEKHAAMKLKCGRYVTEEQVEIFFQGTVLKNRKHFDFNMSRSVLEPMLLDREKEDHTYTHMFMPLIKGSEDFIAKIKNDNRMIHDPPNISSESLLVTIHERAKFWLLNVAKNNILMIPGNLRAGLQTFEGVEVNDLNQKATYTLQHHPSTILPILNKMLSYAFRRLMFSKNGFDTTNDYALANFLMELLLEKPESLSCHPFLVEFCLMHSFRVTDTKIYMIACDAVSSVFAKILSVCKAGVCSVICSYNRGLFAIYGPKIIKDIRDSPVLHILSPMIRQIREMNERIPKRRKTTLDRCGNIIIDQHYFSFDIWSTIVPQTVGLLQKSIKELAIGQWWEEIVDYTSNVSVEVDSENGDITLISVCPRWRPWNLLSLDTFDLITALFEMAFHGFGGGSARMTELVKPTMFHCLYTNNAIYYSLTSLKVFNHVAKRFKQVQRKLPVIISRYYLLFRSLIQSSKCLFENEEINLLLPSRINRSIYGPRHVMRNFFKLASLPDMTQVRQFWAGVSNWVTGENSPNNYITSNEIGALKMGHTINTHSTTYASNKFNAEEPHYNAYHEALGDPSYNSTTKKSDLSLLDLRNAMQLRYPDSNVNGGNTYLSLNQKELVEFGYGPGSNEKKHCIGLLAPGEGKSECFIIPTVARFIGNHPVKTIIYISPYSFLTAYHYNRFNDFLAKLHFDGNITTLCFTGSDITDGNLPIELSNKDCLPSLLFLNIDAMYNLFNYFYEEIKEWINVLEKIVIDEVHTIFSEHIFREKYKVYSKISALGIPIVALSGSIPKFAISRLVRRIGISCYDDLSDIKIVTGDDLIGNFPEGFQIKVHISPTFINYVSNVIKKKLGVQPSNTKDAAVHIIVAKKVYGHTLLELLSNHYNCKLISSDTNCPELTQISSEWGRGNLQILISTTIGLVGNENPKCRYIVCVGYLYDSMQVLQAFGRLRKYMRKPTGEVLFSVPLTLSDFHLDEDKKKYTRLLNDRYISAEDYLNYKTTMTAWGVREWLIHASRGKGLCALKKMLTGYGKYRENCGACLFCRILPITNVKRNALKNIECEKSHAQTAELFLRKLATVCIACNKTSCSGLPLLNGIGSKFLPENKDCCFAWSNCYKCGVSNHNRKTQCFNKEYMNNIACSECWVFKNIPGAKRHEINKCEVKGRLRRLLSHHYLVTKEKKTFQNYIEEIYTSAESFCEFMTQLHSSYMNK
jgi:DEAD/DEAH box helicase